MAHLPPPHPDDCDVCAPSRPDRPSRPVRAELLLTTTHEDGQIRTLHVPNLDLTAMSQVSPSLDQAASAFDGRYRTEWTEAGVTLEHRSEGVDYPDPYDVGQPHITPACPRRWLDLHVVAPPIPDPETGATYTVTTTTDQERETGTPSRARATARMLTQHAAEHPNADPLDLALMVIAQERETTRYGLHAALAARVAHTAFTGRTTAPGATGEAPA